MLKLLTIESSYKHSDYEPSLDILIDENNKSKLQLILKSFFDNNNTYYVGTDEKYEFDESEFEKLFKVIDECDQTEIFWDFCNKKNSYLFPVSFRAIVRNLNEAKKLSEI